MFKSTEKAVNWLCKNRRKNIKAWSKPWYVFDHPEYAHMPKSISSKLTTDAVDAIQYSWNDLLVSAKQFRYSMGRFNKYSM